MLLHFCGLCAIMRSCAIIPKRAFAIWHYSNKILENTACQRAN
jgi:hypothetical protein